MTGGLPPPTAAARNVIVWPEHEDWLAGCATNATGSWVKRTLDNSGHDGATSIAVDSSGKVHISYYDDANTSLKYVTNTTGAWMKTTLDNSGDVGYNNSIAVDSGGKVHIGYTDSALKYVTNASGHWVKKVVDDSGILGSIAVDSNGKVHISYYDYANGALKYAAGP